MTLKKVIASGETDDHELKDMTRRFWFGTIFSLPLFVMEMGSHFFGFTPLSNIIQLVLATSVCLWSACPFYARAFTSLKLMKLNMFTLIGLGVSVAYGYSLVVILLPKLFPASFRDEHGNISIYLDYYRAITFEPCLPQIFKFCYEWSN